MPALPSAPVAAALVALAALSGCAGKDYATGGEAADAYPSARGTLALGESAYWVADRIEGGATATEGIAILENSETLRTEERFAAELPPGVKEGDVLTGGGVAGGALRIDENETAARVAWILRRFERLKSGVVAGGSR